MATFDYDYLDVNNTRVQKVINHFVTTALIVENNTPYPVYISERNTDIPTTLSYDTVVPGGSFRIIPCVSQQFAFFMDIGGVSIPAVGKKCLITFTDAPQLPSASQSNYRSNFRTAFTIVTSGSTPYIINAAGSAGISFDIQKETVTNGFYVTVETSADGITYKIIKRFRCNVSIFKQFPATVDYFRITIQNVDTTETNNGIFTYSLLSVYSAEPQRYNFFLNGVASASLINNASLTPPQALVSCLITDIYLSFTLPAATPNDYYFFVTLQMTGAINIIQYACVNRKSVIPAGSAFVVIGEEYITHRRLNEVAIHIPVEIDSITNVVASATNQSGVTVTDAYFAVQMKAED